MPLKIRLTLYYFILINSLVLSGKCLFISQNIFPFKGDLVKKYFSFKKIACITTTFSSGHSSSFNQFYNHPPIYLSTCCKDYFVNSTIYCCVLINTLISCIDGSLSVPVVVLSKFPNWVGIICSLYHVISILRDVSNAQRLLLETVNCDVNKKIKATWCHKKLCQRMYHSLYVCKSAVPKITLDPYQCTSFVEKENQHLHGKVTSPCIVPEIGSDQSCLSITKITPSCK